MSVPVVFLDFSGQSIKFGDCWDHALLQDLVNGSIWQPSCGYDYELYTQDNFLTESEHEPPKVKDSFAGAVIIIPARQNATCLDKVQSTISQLSWVVLILSGDEGREFNYKKLTHSNMRVWLMQPKKDDEADFYLGSGYTPHTRPVALANQKLYLEKPLDWFFAGQITHNRRIECSLILGAMLLREDIKGELVESKGFTQGLEKDEYIKRMVSAKAVPCPSGPLSQDSFRVFEALEVGAMPIADTVANHEESPYWNKALPYAPIKILQSYADLEGYIMDTVHEYPSSNNRAYMWWLNYKRQMAYTLSQHVAEVSNLSQPHNRLRDRLTVVVLTSPIKSHPDTAIIEETIATIRAHLPDCEIWLCFDGVRPEQEDRRSNYEEYIKRMLWRINFVYSNVRPIIFDKHLHQVGMLRSIISSIPTKSLLFVEGDAPITPDKDIPFEQFVDIIESGEADIIRLHHEALIIPEHEHLMLDKENVLVGQFNTPLRRSSQYSARPHVASVAYYKNVLATYFSPDAKSFIEDRLYGVIESGVDVNDITTWYRHRIWIYTPEGDIKRSYTLDGRAGEKKWDELQTF